MISSAHFSRFIALICAIYFQDTYLSVFKINSKILSLSFNIFNCFNLPKLKLPTFRHFSSSHFAAEKLKYSSMIHIHHKYNILLIYINCT